MVANGPFIEIEVYNSTEGRQRLHSSAPKAPQQRQRLHTPEPGTWPRPHSCVRGFCQDLIADLPNIPPDLTHLHPPHQQINTFADKLEEDVQFPEETTEQEEEKE